MRKHGRDQREQSLDLRLDALDRAIGVEVFPGHAVEAGFLGDIGVTGDAGVDVVHVIRRVVGRAAVVAWAEGVATDSVRSLGHVARDALVLDGAGMRGASQLPVVFDATDAVEQFCLGAAVRSSEGGQDVFLGNAASGVVAAHAEAGSTRVDDLSGGEGDVSILVGADDVRRVVRLVACVTGVAEALFVELLLGEGLGKTLLAVNLLGDEPGTVVAPGAGRVARGAVEDRLGLLGLPYVG